MGRKKETARVLLSALAFILVFSVLAQATDDLTLENTTILSGQRADWMALDSITAQTNYIIQSEGKAWFVTAGEISLKDGFEAQTGSTFTTIVESNLAYWDGGGGDNNWSTAANWDCDTVPSSTSVVYFGSNSNKNCTLTAAVTVAGLIVTGSYTGTIDFNDQNVTINGDLILEAGTVQLGSGTLSVTGDLTVGGNGTLDLGSGTSFITGDFTLSDSATVELGSGTFSLAGDLIKLGGTLIAETSTINLNGTGDQEVSFNSSQTLYNIEVSNTQGVVTFWDGFTANQLALNPGNWIEFGAGETFTIATLTGNGTSANPVVLTSTSTSIVWYLIADNDPSLSYISITRSDASGGDQLTITNGSDGGDNTNFVFGGAEGSPTLTFSPSEEIFVAASIDVTITADDPTDVTIHYTTDGTIPDKTSTTYTSAITISSDTTLRAIGVYMEDDPEGEAISEVVSRNYDKVDSADVYPRKTYGLNALIYCGDTRKFGGQVWWVGPDGEPDEMSGDDEYLSHLDDDIAWSCDGGTITQDGVFTGDGRPETGYTVTLTIGGNSYTGCAGYKSIVEMTCSDSLGITKEGESTSPQTIPTKGTPVRLNIRHYSGWYNLEDYTLGRGTRFAMLHELKVIDADELMIRFIGNNPIGAACRYKKVDTTYSLYPQVMYEKVSRALDGTVVDNGDGTYKFTNDLGFEFHFDDNTPIHRLSKIKDPNSNEITIEYELDDEFYPDIEMRITDASGNKYDFDCDAEIGGEINLVNQVIVRPVGGSSRSWSYEYDSDGFLTKETFDDASLSYEFAYDQWGNRTRFVDYNANAESYEYDDTWRMTKKTDAESQATTYEYSAPSGSWTKTVTYPTGSKDYENITQGVTIQAQDQTSKDGAKEEYEYSYYGTVTKKTIKPTDSSADDIVVEYYYDYFQDRTKEIYDVGGLDLTTSMEYDNPYRLMTKHTDRTGTITEYHYGDWAGAWWKLTEKVVDPSGLAITELYEYDPWGNRTKYTDPEGNVTAYEYDPSGRVTLLTDPLSNTESYLYGNWGNLTSFTDKRGNTATYEYDVLKRLTKETDPGSYTVTYEYDSKGNLTKLTDRNSNDTTAEYDDANRVTKVSGVGASGVAVPDLPREGDYYYDGVGNVTRFADILGREAAYQYDTADRLTKTTKDYGYANITSENYYDKLNRITKTVNENSNYTAFYYDKANRQTKVSRELGGGTTDTTYEYDSESRLTKATDPRSKTTQYVYDNAGRITKATDANSTDTTHLYDDNSNLTRLTQDPSGINAITINYYDDLNRITKTTDAESNDSTFAYDGVGNRTLTTDDNSNDTEYYYDDRDMLTKVTDANSNNTSYEYDGNGNRTKVTDDNSVITAYEYCSRNYVTKQVVDAGVGTLNLTTTYDVHEMGEITKITDPANKVTIYDYDRLYRMTKVTYDYGVGSELNIATGYYYDDADNLTKIEDDSSNATTYEYDDLDRLTKETFADSEYKVYEYDDAGNRTKLVDQVGNSFAMTYNNINRLTKKDITRAGGVNGTSEQVFYYDNLSRMTKATDNNGDNVDSTINQYYDKVGRLTKENQQVAAKTARDIVSEYDGVGNRTKLTYPSTAYLELSYDNVNNLTRIYDGSTAHAVYEYSGTNMITKKTLGTSTAVSLGVEYDNAYRSTKYDWVKSGGTLVGFTYGYSSAGNKNYEEKLHDTDKSQYYIYDSVYRLTAFDEGTLNGGKTGIDSPDYYQDWVLDGLGNWTRFYDNTGTPEYRQHTVTNEMEYRGASAPTQAANHTYDDNGNLTDDGTYEYEYDALNRLIKVLEKDDPDFTVGEYAYDALNRRIWREADEDNDESTDADLMYFYSGWQVVEERDYSDEGLLRDYVYGNYVDEPIFGKADTNDDGDFLDSEEQFYYTSNNLACVAALLDTSGNIIETYEYTPYGVTTIYIGDGGDGDWFDGDESTGSLTGNFYLFTGRRLDPETDLYHYRMRYYSAELGRFASRDPIGYAVDLNLYSYVDNNPVNYWDTFGAKPGSPYSHPLDAANVALTEIIDKSIKEDHEYHCWIIRKRKDGKHVYTYTKPIKGKKHKTEKLGPKPKGAVAVYHTHGKESKGFDDEVFDKDNDRVKHIELELDGYLMTPTKKVLYFNRAKDIIRDVTKLKKKKKKKRKKGRPPALGIPLPRRAAIEICN